MTYTKQISRRAILHTSAGALLAGAVGIKPGWAQQAYTSHPASRIGQPQEGPDTPKLTMYMEDLLDKAEARRLRQIGITWIDTQAVPEQPWGMDYLQPRVDALKAEGMHIGIMMVRWSFNGGMDPNMSQIVYAGPDRDKEISKIKETIVNCGKLGIPVVEYNFYNHRATDGYASVEGRGGATMTEFKYERMKDLPPLPVEGVHTYDQTWSNLEYFLKQVVPVAEKAGVALSLHPNDPPPPMSRGSAQIMNSFSDWKRLIETVNSPSNCLTFDCGVTRELGEDPVVVGNWFASRNRIGQVHFRNVILRKPREDYTEVFPDEGDNDMFEVMKLLVKNNYKRTIMPEHPRGLDADKELPKGWGEYVGWTYDVAYCKAMLQIALRQVRGI
jgi:mannonate dehydratase